MPYSVFPLSLRSGIRDEVNKVMANPEIDGNPIALDFSSKGTSSGFNRKFARNYDDIFRKKT